MYEHMLRSEGGWRLHIIQEQLLSFRLQPARLFIFSRFMAVHTSQFFLSVQKVSSNALQYLRYTNSVKIGIGEGWGKGFFLLSDGRIVIAIYLTENRSKLCHIKCTKSAFERQSRESASIPKKDTVMLKLSKRTR